MRPGKDCGRFEYQWVSLTTHMNGVRVWVCGMLPCRHSSIRRIADAMSVDEYETLEGVGVGLAARWSRFYPEQVRILAACCRGGYSGTAWVGGVTRTCWMHQ